MNEGERQALEGAARRAVRNAGKAVAGQLLYGRDRPQVSARDAEKWAARA